jgi:DNA-binding transcriptional regulator YiaG
LRPTRATLKIFRSTVRRWTVPTWSGGSGRRLRSRLGLTQEGFAERYGIPLSAIRQYEIARTMPPPAVRAYLTVIEREPEMAARALHPDAA